MSLFVVSAKDKTDLYRVNNGDLATEKLKTFTNQNATVCLYKNLLAHTHENNVLNIVKIASDGTTTDISKIQLKDDIRLIQFSPLGTYVQLITYAEGGDNLFIYRIDQPETPVYVCHKKIIKPENSDPQPFLVVFNNEESQMLVQKNETLQILDSTFNEVESFPAHAKNNGYVPCSYFFLGDRIVVSNAATKQIPGRIAVFKGKEYQFGYTNQKVAKYQFAHQNSNFFVARLMFDDGGNYYGNSQLILFDINKKSTDALVKESLNAFCVYQPKSYNPNSTAVIITSEGNPCQLKFTYLTFQKASNSMIIKNESYKHKVYINAMYAKNDLVALRGESGMDGEIYIATWSHNKVKVVIKKLQRDITHVNILKNCILFSTQRPRFQVDNSFYVNDLLLKQQTKFEYDGLRYLKEIEEEPVYENVGKMDDMPEVEVEMAEKQKGSQQSGVYVPPALRGKQGQSGSSGAPKQTSYSRFK